eukprot:GHRR01002872.1.p1 GENE.GHRR01002872.1~~GHRR01002872.1.p1  ORF type:complete len:164 (+),score=41.56 GHRR01002872.1:298-789(+)
MAGFSGVLQHEFDRCGKTVHCTAQPSIAVVHTPQMQLKIQPRVQTEIWSLYWKEPTSTETKCLDAVSMDFDGGDGSTTIASLMDQVAAHLGWPPEDGLTRLQGFTDAWQRTLCKGRLLNPESSLAAAGIHEGDTITVVRVELVAEGWQIQDEYALTDSEDESD